MKLHPLTRALVLLPLFAVSALAIQRPKPTPPPAPAPAPAPAETDAQREEIAKQQRIERARQAEQEAERVKRARQEAERVKRAREEAANQPTPTPANPATGTRADLRETARDMFKIEDVHRDRLGRLERLLEVYRETGDAGKLEEVGKLKAKENKRYLLIMNQFKEKLGPVYAQYEPRLLAGQGPKPNPDKPAAPAPIPAPRRETKPPIKNESTGGGR